MAGRVDSDLYRTFRNAVRARLAEQVASERAASEARKDRVMRALRPALEHARGEGACGRAWLFGSYAWGQPGERSDVDLLVEACPDPEALASIIGRATGTDVHVVTREDAPPSLIERAVSDGTEL